MPENLSKLKSLIQELEQELSKLDTQDEEANELLQQASEEIDQAIHRDDPHSWSSSQVADQLKGRLEEFESRHPTMTAVVNRIAEALGQLGI